MLGFYFLHKQAASAATAIAGSATVAGANVHDALNEMLKGEHNILARKSGGLVEFHVVVCGEFLALRCGDHTLRCKICLVANNTNNHIVSGDITSCALHPCIKLIKGFLFKRGKSEEKKN